MKHTLHIAVPYQSVRYCNYCSGAITLTLLATLPGSGDVPIPPVHPKDAGNFVYTLLALPGGTNMPLFGDCLLWADYVKLWNSVTGIPAVFEKTTIEEHSKLAPEGH
jgi:hypothetical protein